MRLLVSFAGGNGHFQPLIPLAAAARAAGHIVTVTGRPRMAATVAAAGFTFLATGPDRGPPERLPLRQLDPGREDRDLRDGFAGWLARDRGVAMLALCAQWRPDLLVCDETDCAPCPRPATVHPFRSFGPAPVDGTVPRWAADPSGAPVVYATLGTVFNMESGDLFARMLAGLRDLPVEVIVTVGPEIDPAEFGPQPGNVHIERYVAQSSVLPRCSPDGVARRLRQRDRHARARRTAGGCATGQHFRPPPTPQTPGGPA